MMKTRNTGTWAVSLHSVNMGDRAFEFESDQTFIIYDPQFPYLYLPEKDFLTWLTLASQYYQE